MQTLTVVSAALTLALSLSAQEIPAGVAPGGWIEGKAIAPAVFTYPRQASLARLTRTQGLEAGPAPGENAIQADVLSGVCSKLRGSIDQAAREEARTALGITVTPDELAAARAAIPPINPAETARKMNERAKPILDALSAVYDNGRDKHQTWVELLKPKGIDETEWNLYLFQSAAPDGRAKLSQRLVTTPEAIAKAVAAMSPEFGVANRKLETEVDRQIGLKDPQFRAWVEHGKAAEADPDPRHRWVPLAEQKYIDSQRSQWWKGRISTMNITLNDPTLAGRCGLDHIGVAEGKSSR